MSTTRSQKRKNNYQDSTENVSVGLIAPYAIGNTGLLDQDVLAAEPSSAKSSRIENSVLESLSASLKEERTSEIKNLLIESQSCNKMVPTSIFLEFCNRMDVEKSQRVLPFSVFGIVRLFFNFFNKRFPIHQYFDILKSFCYF